MQPNSAIKQYKKINTLSGIHDASPHQLISMLIDGALARLAAAKGCIDHQDIAGKGENLGKSMDIITGLQSSLDMEAGGEISANLNDLYDYMLRTLMTASQRSDGQLVAEVMGLLREIKAGWEGIPREFHHLSAAKKTGAARSVAPATP